MTFPYLPSPPQTNDPENFRAKADAFFGALPAWQQGLSDLGNAASAGFTAVSNTTVTIPILGGTSQHQFLVGAGKGFVAGQTVMVASSSDPSNVWMLGKVSNYSAPHLTINTDWSSGAGTTASSWIISISAPLAILGYVGRSQATIAVPAADAVITIPATSNRSWFAGDTLAISSSAGRFVARVIGYALSSGQLQVQCLWAQGVGNTAANWTIAPSVDAALVNMWTAINSDLTSPTLNLAAAQHFVRAPNSVITFAFANAPQGASFGFSLRVVYGSTAFAITWPNSVRWPGSALPSLSGGRTHLFAFFTDNGGATWRGVSLRNYSA